MVILLILRVFFPVTLLSFTETLSNGCFATCVIADLNCLAGVKNNFNLGCRVASYPLLSGKQNLTFAKPFNPQDLIVNSPL